jgi:hypothetical protein
MDVESGVSRVLRHRHVVEYLGLMSHKGLMSHRGVVTRLRAGMHAASGMFVIFELRAAARAK